MLALDPVGLRSGWGWWRLLGVGLALLGTSGLGAFALYIEAQTGIARGALVLPFICLAIAALLCSAGSRLLRKLDEYERPRLEIISAPTMPYGYVSRTDVGTELEREVERLYSIGVGNPSGVTIDNVAVRLMTIAGKTSAGSDVDDRMPGDLYQHDGGWGPFSVHPRETRLIEVISRFTGGDSFRIRYADGVSKSAFIPDGEYQLTIAVFARDVSSVAGPQHFRAWGDGDGRLMFEPAAHNSRRAPDH